MFYLIDTNHSFSMLMVFFMSQIVEIHQMILIMQFCSLVMVTFMAKITGKFK